MELIIKSSFFILDFPAFESETYFFPITFSATKIKLENLQS